MDKPNNPLALLSPYLLLVEEEMKEILKAEAARDGFYHLLHYHLGWVDADFRPQTGYGGKRIRPAICLMVCEALGGDIVKAVPAAAAIELVHNFSLAHDDVEDRSPTRRGRETLWKLGGDALAINSGDALLILAHLALQRLALRKVDGLLIAQCLNILDEACLSLAQGQYLDLVFEEQGEITVEMYLEMAEKKAARLLEAAAHLGGELAYGHREAIAAFRNFARFLGLGLQVSDDLLGIWGDPQATGKGVGEDIRNKKKSLPVVYALQEEKRRGEENLGRLYERPTIKQGDVDIAVKWLEDLGARAFAEKMVREFQTQALEQLPSLGIQNAAMDKLQKLTLFLAERRS